MRSSLERGVVHARHVPHEVRRKPERKRDRRMRQRAERAALGEPRHDERGEPKYAERRRPLGEDDVLEQVRRQQVMQ